MRTCHEGIKALLEMRRDGSEPRPLDAVSFADRLPGHDFAEAFLFLAARLFLAV